MPLTDKGETIMRAMQKEYGGEKGKSVFYASRNKGTITGVDACPQTSFLDACRRGDDTGIKDSTGRMLRGRMIR